jgi:hypothetical protein
MLQFRVNAVKHLFFDRDRVLKGMSRAERKVLSRFGAFVRQSARQSIRRAPSQRKPQGGTKSRRAARNSSLPGRPPLSHTGLLKKHIYFIYDPQRKSVVIGPARLNKQTAGALEALEYGGVTQLVTKKKSRQIDIAARPFMRPAFDQELKALPPRWQDSLTE